MTTTTLTAGFTEDVTQAGSETTGINDIAAGCNDAGDGRIFRTALRFDPSSITSTDTISQVELIVNCFTASNNSARSYYIGPYNTNGVGDPSADSGATAYSRCSVSGGNYGTFTEFRTTGVKTITLGGSVNSHLQAVTSVSGTVFTLAIQQDSETADPTLDIFESLRDHTDGTDPPKLRVTHAAAASTAVKDTILCAGGVVPFAR